MTTSMNVAGGRGLPVPLAPVVHSTTPRTSYRPPGWDRLPPLDEVAPPPPTVVRKPKRVKQQRKAATESARTGRPPSTTRPRFTVAEVDAMVTDYEARTASLDQLAHRHACHWQRIKDELLGRGVELRGRGGTHKRGDLTPEQLAVARRRYEVDEDSLAVVGAELGIDRNRLRVLLVDAGVAMRGPGGNGKRPKR